MASELSQRDHGFPTGRCWWFDGMFFCRTPGMLWDKYNQLDGSVVDGEICTCYDDPMFCPIDDHAIDARMQELECEA
jgi:hypothetical protein